MTDEVYDKIKGHAVTESNETYLRSLVWKLRTGAATPFIERMAADEIERLAALAQSNAEPESYGDQIRRVMKRQAMQSDAQSDAGLIEAAEIASAFKGNADHRMRSDAGCEGYVRACDDLVVELRARAADRSEK